MTCFISLSWAHLLPVRIRGLIGRKLSNHTKQQLVKSFSVVNASWALHKPAEIAARIAMAIWTKDLSLLSSAIHLNLCNLFSLAITRTIYLFCFLTKSVRFFSWNKPHEGGGVCLCVRFFFELSEQKVYIAFCFLARSVKLINCFVTSKQHRLQWQKVSLTLEEKTGSSRLDNSLTQQLHGNVKLWWTKVEAVFSLLLLNQKHTAE